VSTITRPLAAIFGGLAAVSMGSCSPPNTLSGSLDSLTSLQFTSVNVRASSTAMVIEYDQPDATSTDVVFKLVINPENLTLSQGLQIDLSELIDPVTPRATASRSIASDPRTQLPPILRGQLTLNDDVSVGGVASGSFYILFGQGGQLGEGTTVNGSFQATVADTNPGASP
jgi:hypothetical protein